MAKRSAQSIKRFVAIDANSLVHRAFHAFPPDLTTSAGVQVNAVYGFTSMLLRVLDELDPKYLVCAFDMKEPTFRHTEFVEYKGTRKPTDNTLVEQFPLVKEVLGAFNVPILERKGFEADDILATLAEYAQRGKWKGETLELIIVTGDKDLLQVVHDRVKVWLPRGSFKDLEMYDEAAVMKRFGFGPESIPDFKGLMGDPSDNIPGVKGIGEKSATMLIKEFGHLEEMYKSLDKIKEKQRKLLVEGEESAELSRRLATVIREVPLDVKLEDCLMRDFERKNVLDIFQRFEFRSLMGKIPESVNDGAGVVQIGMFGPTSHSGSQTDRTGRKVKMDDIRGIEEFFADESRDDENNSEHSVILFLRNGVVMAGQVAGKKGEASKYYYGKSIPCRELMNYFKMLIHRGATGLTTYGWEAMCRGIVRGCKGNELIDLVNWSKRGVIDIGLFSYHLSSGQRDYSLKNLAFTHTGVVLPEEEQLSKEDAEVCVDTVVSVNARLKEIAEKNGHSVMGSSVAYVGKPIDRETWKNIDMPLSVTVAEMSERGVSVDRAVLEEKRSQLVGQIAAVETMIYEAVGHEFNINSNRQLADVLFVELGLPVQRKTKTGFSTDESVLSKLKGLHPCIESVLVYRERVKMLNTYVEPLVEQLKSSPNSRIHSTFNQTGTSTGRLSSESPNLQNIPIRTELGQEIRGVFVAGPDASLISVDYSQIDLRVMAHFSKDQNMMDDFSRGVDFHSATASRIFGKKEGNVSESERRIAKTINFGVLYGLSPFGLSEALGIEREDAAKYIESYFEKYMRVREYLEETIIDARRTGFVETVLGRRRYISGLRSDNRIVKAASEREAINMPIQGTSADIMRAAMIDIFEHIQKEYGNEAGLVLQIHDEFLIECSKPHARQLAFEVERIMEQAMTLSVPLECSVEVGNTLASMEKISR